MAVSSTAMNESIIIIPGSHSPKLHPQTDAAKDIDNFLAESCPTHYFQNQTDIIASSFRDHEFQSSQIYSSSASLIRSAIEAWGHHSHLVLRPDDFWFTILVQVAFYMEKHAEDVRHVFVSHAGKQTITVEDITWDVVIERFRKEIQARIKTDWMADWISPGFSTSTRDDELTATVLMMGVMKAYFDYEMGIICGIPSITLLGTKQDWQKLLDKTDRLDTFGKQPRQYKKRLQPILKRIVSSFDDPASPETREFWDQMVQAKTHHSIVCGEPPIQYIVTGWILGLYYWDRTGNEHRALSQGTAHWGQPTKMQYDGVSYGELPLEDIPQGYATVPCTLLNNHKGADPFTPRPGFVAAGNIGKHITNGSPRGYTAGLRLARQQSGIEMDSEVVMKEDMQNTIRPLSGWYIAAPPFEEQLRIDPEDAELEGPTVQAVKAGGIIERDHDDEL